MVWFKVDDTFPLHAKVLAAGNAAVGLWTRAGAWSMQQLTDGFIPDHVARLLGTPAEARSLVAAGLWVPAEGGFTFHKWAEVQRTKEQVEADRHAASERQRHARERAKSRRDARRDSHGSNAASHGPPDQTRPDQTSSSYGTTSEVLVDSQPDAAPAKPASSKKKPAKRLPEDWRPTDAHLAKCRELGVDPRRELEKFRLHAEANDRRQVNWNASFTQWLLNARPQTGGTVHHLPTGPNPDAWMRQRP